MIFDNFLLYFWLNKCSLAEHKRLSIFFKNLTNPSFWILVYKKMVILLFINYILSISLFFQYCCHRHFIKAISTWSCSDFTHGFRSKNSPYCTSLLTYSVAFCFTKEKKKNSCVNSALGKQPTDEHVWWKIQDERIHAKSFPQNGFAVSGNEPLFPVNSPRLSTFNYLGREK